MRARSSNSSSDKNRRALFEIRVLNSKCHSDGGKQIRAFDERTTETRQSKMQTTRGSQRAKNSDKTPKRQAAANCSTVQVELQASVPLVLLVANLAACCLIASICLRLLANVAECRRVSEMAGQAPAVLPLLPAPPPPSASGVWPAVFGGAGPSLMASGSQRCERIGAPPQWRPYLDAASKAHLAPTVALATLKQFNFAPIQLATAASLAGVQATALGRFEPGPASPPLLYHAQNINNVGVLIEATFQINNVLKLANKMIELRPRQSVRLLYRVSASLSTTSDIISLANSDNSSSLAPTVAGGQQQASVRAVFSARQQLMLQRAGTSQLGGEPCALELSEHELVKKGSRLFKVNQDYVLFLDQVPTVSRRALQANQRAQPHGGAARVQPAAPLPVSAQFEPAWMVHALHPFASHEPLNNQTSRSIHKILCKNCAQVAQVQLLNGTFVSPPLSQRPVASKVRLDCRAFGNPSPWVEWFKNGKPLRNKPGRYRVRTGRLTGARGRQSRVSRLEIELQAGRNETGIYECRAMNVAAREPALGAYTLLVLPEQRFALVPVQSSPDGQDQQQQTASQTSDNNGAQQVATGERPALSGGASDGVQHSTPRPQQAAAAATATVTSTTSATSASSSNNNSKHEQQVEGQQQTNRSKSSPVVVGQPCPREAEENFCLNKGTCVLIGHIEEYFCNCAEGYHGHRCEYKSLGHQQTKH